MVINLYANTRLLNRLDRTFAPIATLDGHLREGCDVINPDIWVEYDASYLNANYAYIAAFNRYYYFREPPAVDGKRMLLMLHADALYNYRDLIRKSECIADRSSSNYNPYLDDDAVSQESGYEYYSRSLPFEFTPDSGSYVLICAGGS